MSYNFLTTNKSLKKGDMVIVQDRYGLAVVKVAGQPKPMSADCTYNCWVIQRVNTNSNKIYREMLEKARQLQLDMEQRMSEIQVECKYKAYAKLDSEMAKMLAQYNELVDG